jgi:hypothetical protein
MVWAKRVGVALLVLLLLAFGWAYALTYRPTYARIPQSVWGQHDPGLTGRAIVYSRVIGDMAQAARDSSRGRPTGAATLDPVPLQVLQAGDRWVASVNEMNPDAILLHRVDGYGNLYVAFGAWWGDLDSDQMVVALNNIGVAWRQYLIDSFGDWDTREDFTPGIVVVDDRGKLAENINKKVRIFRRPST